MVAARQGGEMTVWPGPQPSGIGRSNEEEGRQLVFLPSEVWGCEEKPVYSRTFREAAFREAGQILSPCQQCRLFAPGVFLNTEQVQAQPSEATRQASTELPRDQFAKESWRNNTLPGLMNQPIQVPEQNTML